MQSHSRPKLEIESLQSQQRPDADVYYTDSDNRAMAHGLGLDPRSHPMLEHGSEQHRGHAYDQGRGDRSEQPPSSAGSKELQESVRVDQWDVIHACPPGKGGIAKLDFRRTISSLGLSPKKRLNSRLNCDALSYPTSMLAACAVFSFRNISRRA
jgi:hypothetical protein